MRDGNGGREKEVGGRNWEDRREGGETVVRLGKIK